MSDRIFVVCVWIIANLVGFWVGWDAGGNDFAARGVEAAMRNAFYGLAFGAAQAIALWAVLRPKGMRLAVWILATSLAFTLGVHFWRHWAGNIPGYRSGLGCLQLGVPLGLLMPLAHAWALRFAYPHIERRALHIWMLADCASWLVIEYLSCAVGYGGLRIALSIVPGSVPTAIALALIAPALATPVLRAETGGGGFEASRDGDER